MHQLIKVTLSKFSCAPNKIVIEKPTITTESPICPFDFYVQSSSFVQPASEVTHTSTMWELASDINFLNVLATIETIDDKDTVLFPAKYLEENKTYYLRAYFITDYGESEWSETLTVATKFVTTSEPEALDITGTTLYEDNKGFITEVAGKPIRISFVFDSNGNFLEIAEKITDGDWVRKATYSHPSGITSVDPNNYDGGYYSYQYDDQFQIFPSCTSETELFFCATLMTGDINETTPRTLIGIYLFRYDTATETLSTLITDNTGLFKRDSPALFYYNREIFIQGGYQLDANGLLVIAADEERTLCKYNLDTHVLSDVTVTSAKPRNYRYSFTSTKGDKSFLFSGYGKTKPGYSPEFWCFDHSSNSWIALQMFREIDLLAEDNPSFAADISNDGLFFNMVIFKDMNSRAYLIQYDMIEDYWLPSQEITHPFNLVTFSYPSYTHSMFLKNESIYVLYGIEQM